MANKKISDLTKLTNLLAASMMEVESGGSSYYIDGDDLAESVFDLFGISATYDTINAAANKTLMASFPAHYERDAVWLAKTVSVAADRYALLSPSYMTVNIDDSGYVLTAQEEIDLSAAASWDDITGTDWTVAANRAGKDFYIYACEPSSGVTPDIVLSDASTYPTGYTADNSRKLGGFHCLCEDVGTISGHTLTGYVAGDILPASVWDLKHRPVSDPEGMVYVDGIGKWMDIYLPSWDGAELVSENGGTIADGASTKKFHWYKFTEEFGKIGKRLPMQQEFIPAAKGSPEGTNISGSADPGTTGGHSDTASRRIISNYGCEDMTGGLWQWGADGGATNDVGSAWANAFDSDAASDNAEATGQHYEAPNRPLFGGDWSFGAECGSRGSAWSYSPLYLAASVSARGVAETKA